MTGGESAGEGAGETGFAVCSAEPGCITCGDVAVALTVVAVDAALDGAMSGADARCRDDSGREELVATELVGPVRPGERLLVHAGVAIERLDPESAPAPAPASVQTTAPITVQTTAPITAPITEGRPDALRR